MEQLSEFAINSLRKKCKESLFFLSYAVLGFDDFTKEIHRPVCQALQNYRENTRLLVVFPRDWFKSTMGSIAYPIWRSIDNPNVRILVTQNSFSNACKKLNAIKQIFENNKLFRTLFPELMPTSKSVWKLECLTVNRTASHPEGTFEAAGTGTAVTSRHYDLIIEDDTVSPDKDAMTDVIQQPTKMDIEKAIGWHRVAYPLLLHPSKSQRVVIGTRWAVHDLIGWIMENNTDFKLLSRKARENGKAVWDRFDENVLIELERVNGPFMFASLYLNDPQALLNQVFQLEWIQYYQNTQGELLYCTSIDPATSKSAETSEPDYTVVLTTGLNVETGEIFIMRYDRGRMNPGEQIQAIFSHYDQFSPLEVRVEAIAYQRTLSYWLKKQQAALGKYFYIVEVKSLTASKEDRIRGLQPFYANGQIKHRAGMVDLERELLAFPKGKFDDVIDALTLHLPFWAEQIKLKKKEDEMSYVDDPFSGASIIDALEKRATQFEGYPYDMGINCDSKNIRQYRVYDGVGVYN